MWRRRPESQVRQVKGGRERGEVLLGQVAGRGKGLVIRTGRGLRERRRVIWGRCEMERVGERGGVGRSRVGPVFTLRRCLGARG